MSKKLKISKWRSGNMKPMRDGIYQRLYNEFCPPRKIYFCLFSNGKWKFFGKDYADAKSVDCISGFQDELKWRGIVK